jgi:hypothetical protein
MSKKVFLVLFVAIGICGISDWAFEKYLGKTPLTHVFMSIDFTYHSRLAKFAKKEGLLKKDKKDPNIV